MPKEAFGDNHRFLSRDVLLTFEEITRSAQIFANLGVKKIRLTGGEPLLRHDLSILIMKLAEIEGIEDIALTTNGVLLPKFAKILKKVGLQRVNVSLDSLSEQFGAINGRGISSEQVIAGIHAAKEAQLGVKVNMVVKKGMNEDQIVPMADFCKKEGIQLRYIEFMDVGNSNDWKLDEVVTKADLITELSKHYSLEAIPRKYGDVATRYRYTDCGTEVGVITSVSETFCTSCSRARLSADGRIYTCLFSEQGHNLKQLLRDGSDDEAITNYIREIWQKRDDRYSELRATEVEKRKKIEMSFIGG